MAVFRVVTSELRSRFVSLAPQLRGFLATRTSVKGTLESIGNNCWLLSAGHGVSSGLNGDTIRIQYSSATGTRTVQIHRSVITSLYVIEPAPQSHASSSLRACPLKLRITEAGISIAITQDLALKKGKSRKYSLSENPPPPPLASSRGVPARKYDYRRCVTPAFTKKAMGISYQRADIRVSITDMWLSSAHTSAVVDARPNRAYDRWWSYLVYCI
jgi:hypothetical protein